jgi:hypothetical protein
MKLGEAFSVSVEDSTDPDADASAKGGDPWFYLVGLSIKTALYHYYRWHSSVNQCADIRYVGDDFDIQFFDADRTSLFDAGNTLLKSSKYGAMVCDRQGSIYFETDVGAIDSAESTLNTNMFIDSHDWMGTPSITEKYTDEVSYLEMGGVAYYGLAAGSGTYSALLSAAPGETPGYRGKNLKLSGLALSTQGQLNTLVGNIWENMNATFPEASFDLVGNYRNFDIAPQEVVTITLQTDDTFRGLTWTQKAFTPISMSCNYDPEKGTFLPTITLKEVTQGDAGETIAIPVAPPDEGFDQPPLTLVPPPVPALPIPPLDWGFLGYDFAPFLGGYDQAAAGVFWGSHASTLAGIEIDGGHAFAAIGTPSGATSCIAYPVIANNGAEVTLNTLFQASTYHIGDGGATEFEQVSTNFTYAATDLNWLSSHALTITVVDGDVIVFGLEPAADSDIFPWGVLIFWS